MQYQNRLHHPNNWLLHSCTQLSLVRVCYRLNMGTFSSPYGYINQITYKFMLKFLLLFVSTCLPSLREYIFRNFILIFNNSFSTKLTTQWFWLTIIVLRSWNHALSIRLTIVPIGYFSQNLPMGQTIGVIPSFMIISAHTFYYIIWWRF